MMGSMTASICFKPVTNLLIVLAHWIVGGLLVHALPVLINLLATVLPVSQTYCLPSLEQVSR